MKLESPASSAKDPRTRQKGVRVLLKKHVPQNSARVTLN